MTNKWLEPLNLKGDVVSLIPISKSHRNELLEAAGDGELWKLWFTSVPSEDSIDSYLNFALSEQEKGNALPFVVLENSSGKIIGSTRFCNIDESNRRLEIGYTWYAKSYQRTTVNTECKLLLLEYAFEVLGCIAVAFMTNWHNQKSREAILRLGAKQDGVLRNHRIDPDGAIRDTVVFSILQQEWAAVKKNLEFKLG